MVSPPGRQPRGLLLEWGPFPAAPNCPPAPPAPFPVSTTSYGDEEVEEDEGCMDDDSGGEEDAELADGTAGSSSQQRGISSSPGMGRAAMNGNNGARHIQEEQQWQQHNHVYNRGTEQYGCMPSRGDGPGTVPRDLRVKNGYGGI